MTGASPWWARRRRAADAKDDAGFVPRLHADPVERAGSAGAWEVVARSYAAHAASTCGNGTSGNIISLCYATDTTDAPNYASLPILARVSLPLPESNMIALEPPPFPFPGRTCRGRHRRLLRIRAA